MACEAPAQSCADSPTNRLNDSIVEPHANVALNSPQSVRISLITCICCLHCAVCTARYSIPLLSTHATPPSIRAVVVAVDVAVVVAVNVAVVVAVVVSVVV